VDYYLTKISDEHLSPKFGSMCCVVLVAIFFEFVSINFHPSIVWSPFLSHWLFQILLCLNSVVDSKHLRDSLIFYYAFPFSCCVMNDKYIPYLLRPSVIDYMSCGLSKQKHLFFN
jgi:hypothetical protein